MLEVDMSLVDLGAELLFYNFIIMNCINDIFLFLSSEEAVIVIFLLFLIGELELVFI
jgi:hypothetical protein